MLELREYLLDMSTKCVQDSVIPELLGKKPDSWVFAMFPDVQQLIRHRHGCRLSYLRTYGRFP